MSRSPAKDQARTIWRARLDSASRVALACAIVGGVALYGSSILVNQIKFVPLSYVVVILILFNNAATVGHAVIGLWHTLFATAQVVPLAALGRWLVDPAGRGLLPLGVAVAAAAVATFLVVLPESTHVTAKRIALAQIVLVCTEVVVSTDETSNGFMNPIHIAASAVLGAFASLLALLLPFPSFSHCKVKKLCKVYAENASERMDIYLKALNSEDQETKTELGLQAKLIAEIGTKLLSSIKILQQGMRWEQPWRRYSEGNSVNVEQRLQSIELPIRAMEYALFSSPIPVHMIDRQSLSDFFEALSTHLRKKFQEILYFPPFDSKKSPQTAKESTKIPSLPPGSTFPTTNHELSCFVFSCIDTLINGTSDHAKKPNGPHKTELATARKPKSWALKLPTTHTLQPAIKYSVALALSVLLGVILERENACWAGLMVATCFTASRQAVFTAANARGQGTAIGSVYGVICCLLFHRPDIRLIALFPWIVFTGFLKHSKMYSPAGGISAAVAALFILGRKDYGPPDEFAINRLTSVFIGLFCWVLVEMSIQPVRAATLARTHLFQTLVSCQELLKELGFCYAEGKSKHGPGSKLGEFREKHRVLKGLVPDAESEPDFWYLPFHDSCYKRVVASLSNEVNVLYILMHNLEMLSRSEGGEAIFRELGEKLNYEMEILHGTVDSVLEKLSPSEKSSEADEVGDVEAGEMSEQEKNSGSISEEVVKITTWEDTENGGEMIKYLSAVGFCITCMRKEMNQIENCVKEIVRWGI